MALPNEVKSRAFRSPIVAPDLPVREVPSASLADLVRMLAEGIADAQLSLDRASAELIIELLNTKVQIIPQITEQIINDEGQVSYQPAAPQEVSLLDIGITPTFYQFSQTTIEVAMDIKIVESESESTGDQLPQLSLFADTASVRSQRQYNRETNLSSKLTTTLIPVPKPLRLEPIRTTTGGTDPAIAKRQISEVNTLFAGIKTELLNYYSDKGEFPTTLAELEGTPVSGTYVAGFSYERIGNQLILQASMKDSAAPEIAGKTIRYTYYDNTWYCRSGEPNGVPETFLPNNCQHS
jgi:hypothetical protein